MKTIDTTVLDQDAHVLDDGQHSNATDLQDAGFKCRNKNGRAGIGYDWKSVYIEALEKLGSKGDAAIQAGVAARTVQQAKKDDLQFAARERIAMAVVMEKLEDKITERALFGDKKMKVTADGGVIEEVVYSDTIQLRLAEKLESGQWRQRQQVEVGGVGTFGTMADRRSALEAAEKARDDSKGVLEFRAQDQPA